jgi:hypothetical protein
MAFHKSFSACESSDCKAKCEKNERKNSGISENRLKIENHEQNSKKRLINLGVAHIRFNFQRPIS